MIVLVIDTALGACTAAVFDGERSLAVRSEPMTKGHSERLGGFVRDAMAEAAIGFDAVERIGVTVPEDGPYETLGGFVMERLGRVPRVGDEVEVDGWRLRVIAMDTRRVERLQLSPLHGRRAARTEASR